MMSPSSLFTCTQKALKSQLDVLQTLFAYKPVEYSGGTPTVPYQLYLKVLPRQVMWEFTVESKPHRSQDRPGEQTNGAASLVSV